MIIGGRMNINLKITIPGFKNTHLKINIRGETKVRDIYGKMFEKTIRKFKKNNVNEYLVNIN